MLNDRDSSDSERYPWWEKIKSLFLARGEYHSLFKKKKKNHLNFFFNLSLVFKRNMLFISVNTLVCTFLPRSIKK